MKKLGKVVFSCHGSSLSSVSEDPHERTAGTADQRVRLSCELRGPSPRANLVCTVSYADKPAAIVKKNATLNGIDDKAQINTLRPQPYPAITNKKEVTTRSHPVTHVAVTDHILVPLEVVHTASQMTTDITSMRTLNWAVAHAASLEIAENHVRGVAFATLPKKESKHITAATDKPQPTDTAVATGKHGKKPISVSKPANTMMQTIRDSKETATAVQTVPDRTAAAAEQHEEGCKPVTKSADSMIETNEGSATTAQARQTIKIEAATAAGPPPAVDTHPAYDVWQAAVGHTSYLRADKLVDIAEKELPSYMRKTAIVLTRQRGPMSTPIVQSNHARLPDGSPPAPDIQSAVGSIVHQAGVGTNRHSKTSFPSVASNRAAALRAVHGRAMRQRLADADSFPKQHNFDKASAQYKALLFSSSRKRIELVPGKPGLSSVKSAAAPMSTVSSMKPGPVSSPAMTSNLGGTNKLPHTSKSVVCIVKPGPASSSSVTTKLGSVNRPNNSYANPPATIKPGPKSSPAVPNNPSLASRANNLPLTDIKAHSSRIKPQTAMASKAVQATNSIAVQTSEEMHRETAFKDDGREYIDKVTQQTTDEDEDEETAVDSPRVTQQRLVARLWRGVPIDYVAKKRSPIVR